MSRLEVEAYALYCCFTYWLLRDFKPSPPGSCLRRGGEGGADPVPFGTVTIVSDCVPIAAWHEGGKARRVAALAEVGSAIHSRSRQPMRSGAASFLST
jgi:hypothetical protein